MVQGISCWVPSPRCSQPERCSGGGCGQFAEQIVRQDVRPNHGIAESAAEQWLGPNALPPRRIIRAILQEEVPQMGPRRTAVQSNLRTEGLREEADAHVAPRIDIGGNMSNRSVTTRRYRVSSTYRA